MAKYITNQPTNQPLYSDAFVNWCDHNAIDEDMLLTEIEDHAEDPGECVLVEFDEGEFPFDEEVDDDAKQRIKLRLLKQFKK